MSTDQLLRDVAAITSGTVVDDDTVTWALANVTSIRSAVSGGAHETLWYPACGSDLLRATVAYDASHVIGVDIDPEVLLQNSEHFRQLGNAERVTHSGDGSRHDLDMHLDGKDRHVTLICGDARDHTPARLGLSEVDVVHIYRPAQASGGGSRGERQAITESLLPHTYAMVSTNGFLVLRERSLQPGAVIGSIGELTGLEELQIVRRHPFTVLTGYYESRNDVMRSSRDGVIYHKRFSAHPLAIECAADALSLVQGLNQFAEEVEQGEFGDLGWDPQTVDAAMQLESRAGLAASGLREIGQQLDYSPAWGPRARRFVAEAIGVTNGRINQLQRDVNASLRVVADTSIAFSRGTLSKQQALDKMGIEQTVTQRPGGIVIGPRNTCCPLALQIASGSEGAIRIAQHIAGANLRLPAVPTIDPGLV